MSWKSGVWVIGAALLTGSLRSATALSAAPGATTEHVSVTSSGGQANQGSLHAAISANGQFVVFQSFATNLVAGDTNGVSDIFVRDRSSGTTERVSVSTQGIQGNGLSGNDLFVGGGGPSISADGRFVAFSSLASNLVSDDTNQARDIFLRDRFNGTTERVSVNSSGAQGIGNSFDPAISADGQFVAFLSSAVFDIGDTNGFTDVFVRDLQRHVTRRLSVGTGGENANAGSIGSSTPNGLSTLVGPATAISADGRYVAFVSSASNLTSFDSNGKPDIFVRDRLSLRTQRIDVGYTFANSNLLPISISGDGRYVAYFDPSFTVVVRDLVTGATEQMPGKGFNSGGSISPDGRFVAFVSSATDLVAGDTNNTQDIFLRDRALGTTERVSLTTAGGQANGSSSTATVSGDGRFVAFESLATNLVSGSDLNGTTNIFVRDRAVTPRAQLTVADVQTTEGSGLGTGSTKPLVFTVNLSTKIQEPVSFRYWTEDFSAQAGADYIAQSGSATIPAGASSVNITVPMFTDFSAESNETMHLNIDVPVNASIADGQGVGTIVNDDSSLTFSVGVLDLAPANATVAAGERLNYRLSWTVPGLSWRDLNTIELRIGEAGSLLWLRFEESSGAFSLLKSATGDFRPSFPAPWPAVLTSGTVNVYLSDSRVIAAGPDSPEVTLELSLGFKPQAVGTDYPVEVRATNDSGEIQGFQRAGTLTITPGVR